MVETMQGSVAGTLTGPGPGLLVAEQVHKVYRTGQTEVHALAGLDLAVGHGELVAVMGPSGSGKTTLLNCLSGLDEIDGGRVLVEGHDLFAMTDAQRTEHRARSMGFIFQSFNLIPVFNAAENVELPAPPHRGPAARGSGSGHGHARPGRTVGPCEPPPERDVRR